MNKKCALISMVLIALMTFSLVPASKAWVQMPSGHDDKKFSEYGPQASELLINIYSNYAAELASFETGSSIDIMDTPLLPADFAYLRATDPTNTTFMEQFSSQFSLYEYDLNDLAMPTNIPAFRVALSWLINKDYFINYYSGLAGSATRADSPIASLAAYYNPACPSYETGPARTTLGDGINSTQTGPNDYQDMLNAYEALMTALGPPVLDSTGGDNYTYGNYMWNWTSPYQTPSVHDGFGALPNGHLLVFARSSSPARTSQGNYLKELLEKALPDWINTNKAYLKTLPSPYTLPLGCNGAHVYVNLYVTTSTICRDQVMSVAGPNEYRYNVYTGGWGITRDPNFLEYYTTAYSSSHVMQGASNYGGFEDSAFDSLIYGYSGYPNTGLLVTTSPGGSATFHETGPGGHTVGNATYWAYQAQIEMMQPSECALIPMWYISGFTACLSADRNVVNTVGTGLYGWQTFLNAYNSKAGTGGYWEPFGQFTWGFQSDWTTGNPITAGTLADWNVLNEIYDSLISVNPYNASVDRPDLATSWTYGNWTAPTGDVWLSSGTCTTITFRLRQDVFWQDVPYGERYCTWNGSGQICGPFSSVRFTPVDVAFSIMYVRDLDRYDSTCNGGDVDGVVDHVVLNPCWQSLWNTCFYHRDMPVWFNTTAIDDIYDGEYPNGANLTWVRPDGINNVQFSSSVDPGSIQVDLTGPSGWIGLHSVGSLPILPFHIWSQIPQDTWKYKGSTVTGAGSLDPVADDILYGTGPYILTQHNAGVSFTLTAYQQGAYYEGIYSTDSYFASTPTVCVQMNPSRISGIAGQRVNATLEISNVTNLSGFQAGCTFDPKAAHCVGVVNGGFIGSPVIVPGTINNTLGVVTSYNIYGSHTWNGSGALMIFEFQMVTTSYSDLHIANWRPYWYESDIPSTTIDYFTTPKGVVQLACNPEGIAGPPPPYEGFSALQVQATNTSVNGVVYNGNLTFTINSPDAGAANNNYQGLLNVTIPKTLMTCNTSDQWYLSLNGVQQASRSISENANDTFISLEFAYAFGNSTSSVEQVEILSVYCWTICQYVAPVSTTGKNVTVAPATCAQVTFTNVTTTGVLKMNITQTPSNTTALMSGTNSVYVNFQTNATYHGNVTLQFAYNPSGLTLADQQAMRMWLWNTTSSKWVDITTSVDLTKHIVYGVSPHLSMFGITCTLGLTDSTGAPIYTQWQIASSPPAGLPNSLEALAYYDIQATKPYSPGNVNIRLNYNSTTITPVQAQFLQMWVYNTTSSTWANITTGVDTTNNVLYGVSPHLSMFGITSLQSMPQNLTVTGASCAENVVGPGCTYSIQAPIKNWGIQPSSFEAVIYANSTVVYTSQIGLPSLGQTTVNFVLNTTAMRSGNYAISVWNQLIEWINVTARGQAGITGYKLVFKETVDNPFSTSRTINYYWAFSVQKWSGTQWVATAISGSSAAVAGYSIPALTTMNLPYSACLLPASGTNAVNMGDWLKISYTFHWTYSGINYSVSYSAKLNVHPADTSGATVAPPYFGADGKVSTADLTLLAKNWGKAVAWTGNIDPTDDLHRADPGMFGKVSTGDLTILARYWGARGSWSNSPPPS